MKNKKIIIAFAMLLLTGVALSTASYAWFTANTQIQLGKIDVQVQATNGIQVSTDANNWKATLTTDELRNAYYTGGGHTSITQFPDVENGDFLQPVSTDGTVSSGKFTMFYGQLQDDASITLTNANETNGTCSDNESTTPKACETAGETWSEATDAYFIAFDLFIQSSAAANVEVGLLPTSTVNVATGTDAGLKSSIRVGFVNNGVDSTNTPNTAYALNDSKNYTIWEPNADTHTATAINQGSAVAGNRYTYMGAKGTGTKVAVNNSTQFSNTPYQPTDGAGYLVSTNTANTYFVRSTSMSSGIFPTASAWNTTTSTNYPTVLTLSQGINKVRVYIWIEGQDVDCENTATLGNAVGVTINLNAKTN